MSTSESDVLSDVCRAVLAALRRHHTSPGAVAPTHVRTAQKIPLVCGPTPLEVLGVLCSELVSGDFHDFDMVLVTC